MNIKENVKEIEKILQEFSELIEEEIDVLIIDGVEYKATDKDTIEFIKDRWLEASEKLYELGIDTNY